MSSRQRRAAPVLLCLLLLLTGPAAAETQVLKPEDLRPEDLRPRVWHRATAVVDGDTLVLDDGRELRLVGLQAPKLPLGRRGFRAWPLAEEAKAVLEQITLDRRLGLAFTGRREDRHGRRLAHLQREDGLWVQGELLDRGLARVYSFADNRALIVEMLARERAARAAGRGIWGHPFYALRQAGAAAADIGSFQLVEGRVVEAVRARGRVYLNFGADWRTDFTISIAPKAWKLFEAEGIAPDDYRGRRLRVRGWLKALNGPSIAATHPEQIEVLAE